MKRYNILVTGGCGFIGWNFIRRLYENQDKIKFNKIVNLDKLDYSGINTKKESYYDDRYVFVRGDMKYDSFKILNEHKIDLIVNFAAHTHVDNSIKSSHSFIENNVVAMHMLMEEARVFWNKRNIDGTFVQISTDEVMGSVEDNNGYPFNINTPIQPNNPYSATKAAAELLANSYFKTYNFPVIITRCSNNYGKGQHREKLIPKIIECYGNGTDVPIYGDGKQSRDWIYVDDHCDGIIDAITKGEKGSTYMFGTNKTLFNIDITHKVLEECYKFYPSYVEIKHVTDRMGHDRTYCIDYSDTTNKIGWEPKTTLEKGLEETVKWYLNNYYGIT